MPRKPFYPNGFSKPTGKRPNCPFEPRAGKQPKLPKADIFPTEAVLKDGLVGKLLPRNKILIKNKGKISIKAGKLISPEKRSSSRSRYVGTKRPLTTCSMNSNKI